ncbi:aromatic amino acid ammonia-lyase [Mesorhizobium qingshengii]|uniref:Aromatic amino acid ammonia-lyase n=1 Tax=Mesorhizobium qingshengii TaxID=1165689 RepID=A0ABT4QTV7_9HYPH|nr:aromatic amino acid lyase [Mesorhizobium qingshengii]MCZ8544809.1 aromatic amino acid ammonia-lyase [Mesorhizobium qingshengii]
MPIILTTREDINLDTVLRVAWKKDTVEIGETALRRIADCRASFLKLIETDPPPVIYGVTTAMGELASQRLAHDERDRHARIKAFAAATRSVILCPIAWSGRSCLPA